MASSVLSCFLLFITVYTAGGFRHFDLNRCVFNSTELKDIEYILSYHYNKVEYIRFSSSVGKFVGVTEYGVWNAERMNNDTAIMAQMNGQKERYCQHNISIYYPSVLTKSVEPYVVLDSDVDYDGKHPYMLVCSVYNFYPSQIKVSWERDGQDVTSDVTSTDVLPDGDWYYQIHSQLEYTPRSGEKISCVVEHASLRDPLFTYWDTSLPESERHKIGFGASGLVLGLILSLAGLIYYKRKSIGRILVPNN